MKFGRKVCIVPFEKMHSVLPPQTDNGTVDKDEQHDNKKVDEKEITEKKLADAVKELFPSDDHFRKAMAITYMLNLDPAAVPVDRHFLLYTQVEGHIPPKQAVHLYHTLDVADVPLTLISNSTLSKTLKKLRTLREEEEVEEEDESEEEEDSGDREIERERERALMEDNWLRRSKTYKSLRDKDVKRKSDEEKGLVTRDKRQTETAVKKAGNSAKKKRRVSNSKSGWIDLF